MKEKLAGLLSVKTIITFVIITVFAILALRGSIASDVAMPIITMVVAFYFGTQVEKKTSEYEEPRRTFPRQRSKNRLWHYASGSILLCCR